MKALTASLLTLGIAAAAGVSTSDVLGEHGQPEAPVARQVAPAVESSPLANTPSIAPEPRCGTTTPRCRGSVCTQPVQRACLSSPEQLAASLHVAAVTLVDDIDFDLYGTCNFSHLIRDAEIVVRDVINVRRLLAGQAPIDTVMAGVRNAGTSLRRLERLIGRRYRTRAIHFTLLDTGAALDDLAGNLAASRPENNAPPQSPSIDGGSQLLLPAPQSDGLRRVPAVPQETRPPVPPALRSSPQSERSNATPLVLPSLNDVPTIPDTMKGVRQLSLADQRLAMQQRTCPVTRDLLGSMGKPIKVSVNGRTVFVCCQGCVDEVQTTSGRRR